MPVIQGKLSTITKQPSRIKEVWLRPVATRPGDGGLIVDEPVRVVVDERGEFSVDVAVGAAVLVLIGADFTARESIPLLVHEGTATLRQAVEDAQDFTPEVHDRLATLADEVARGVQAVVEAQAAVVGDRRKAEAAAQAAAGSASAAGKDAQAASSVWQQVKDRLEQWDPKFQQLDAWQPQYEWLKKNAASSFAVVQEKITQATDVIVSQVKGDAEAVKRDAVAAGLHSLKAQAAAKDAETTSTRIVDAAIAKLKGSAPEMLDTLEELAERVKSGGTLEAEIIQKLSKMADSETVTQLKTRLDHLTVAGVKGLSQALAVKANAGHAHGTSEITGLEDALGRKVDRGDVVGIVEKSRKVEEAWDYARRALAGMPDLRVVDVVPEDPSPNVWYFLKEPS